MPGDAAIQLGLSDFAALANPVVTAERGSDSALDCFASLAMTKWGPGGARGA